MLSQTFIKSKQTMMLSEKIEPTLIYFWYISPWIHLNDDIWNAADSNNIILVQEIYKRNALICCCLFLYRSSLKRRIFSNLWYIAKAPTAILLIIGGKLWSFQLNQEEVFLRAQALFANRVLWWSRCSLTTGYVN